jgi:hypothetical protein
MKVLFATLVAVLLTASSTDATAGSAVRHRPRHSSRVSQTSESAPAKKKKSNRKKKSTHTQPSHKKAPPSTKPK